MQQFRGNTWLNTNCKSCGGSISQAFAERNGGCCAICNPLPADPNQALPQVEKLDPIESDPEMAELLASVDEIAAHQAATELALSQELINMMASGIYPRGFCHKFWSCKQRILRESYGIDWKSPPELNPGVWYD